MGSYLEVNDTLQLTKEQGFPTAILDYEKHLQKPILLSDVSDTLFEFRDKPNARIFHLDPVRVYLVHNIDGKWLFWGRVLIQSQTISKKLVPGSAWKEGDWLTSGTYKIIDLYDPDYQKTFTTREAPPDRNFFLP